MSPEAEDRKGGISIRTLLIASAASATATLVVPLFWRPGTLAAAAVTPIIVALVSEALNRPKLPAVPLPPVPIPRTRRGGGAAAAPPREGRGAPTARPPVDRFGLYAPDRRQQLLRAGVVTGLLAFLVVGAVWTVGELAAGESLSGGARTTYFGGKARERDAREESAPDRRATPAPEETAAPTAPEDTPTPEPTATPTPTATPGATVTPTPTVTPGVAPDATPAPTTTPGGG